MYTSYVFDTQRQLRAMRDIVGKSFRNLTDDEVLKMINRSCFERESMVNTAMMVEYAFMRSKNAMSLFVDREMAEFVQRCGYDIQPSAIRFPASDIIMHFGKGITVAGHELAGSMLISKDTEHTVRYKQEFFDRYGVNIGYEVAPETCWFVTEDPKANRTEIEGHMVNATVKLFHHTPMEQISESLNQANECMTPSQKILGNRLDDDQKLYFEEYIRLVCRVLIYAGVFPDAIKSGVPEKYLYGTNGNTFKTPSVSIGSSDTIRSIMAHPEYRTAHFRCGHFRSLTAERWVNKRGHTVFVRPTFVGLDVEQAHLEQAQ